MGNFAQQMLQLGKGYASGSITQKPTSFFGAMAYKLGQNPVFKKKYGMQQAPQQTPPIHQPPMPQQPQFPMAQGSTQAQVQPQFGMAQGSAQGMGSPYRQPYGMMGQQTDPYGYATPQMGQLMKLLGGNNTGRFTGYPR